MPISIEEAQRNGRRLNEAWECLQRDMILAKLVEHLNQAKDFAVRNPYSTNRDLSSYILSVYGRMLFNGNNTLDTIVAPQIEQRCGIKIGYLDIVNRPAIKIDLIYNYYIIIHP